MIAEAGSPPTPADLAASRARGRNATPSALTPGRRGKPGWSEMDRAIAAFAERQRGVVSRAQLLGLGAGFAGVAP